MPSSDLIHFNLPTVRIMCQSKESRFAMQKQATITSKGQITVPLEVRKILGVRAGDKLMCVQRI